MSAGASTERSSCSGRPRRSICWRRRQAPRSLPPAARAATTAATGRQCTSISWSRIFPARWRKPRRRAQRWSRTSTPRRGAGSPCSPIRSAMDSACSSSAAAATTRSRLELSGERAGELGRRDLAAAARILPAQEEREIARAAALGLRAQWRDGGGGERVRRRAVVERAELAHQAVHHAARRPAGEDVGQHRAVRTFALERRAQYGAGARFRAEKIGRADLYAGSAQRHCRGYSIGVGDAARSDDGDIHGSYDLRHKRQRPGLRGKVEFEEAAAVSAGFQALGNDRIDALRFQPACLFDGGGRGDDLGADGPHACEQLWGRQAEMKADYSRPKLGE